MLDKDEIKSSLSIHDIITILNDFGADPVETSSGLTCLTICHNHPSNNPSRKLYYYENSNLFQCYTGCAESSFDIFEVVIKALKIQKDEDVTLVGAMYYILNRLNINERAYDSFVLEDQDEFLGVITSILDYNDKTREVVLKEYPTNLIDNMPTMRIKDWEKEGISYNTLLKYNIRYYSPTGKILIPHYDENGRLIGIRGRTLCIEEAEKYGKYMPLQTYDRMYNHPLGFALYGLDKNKENIQKMKVAIAFEGEKSVMMYDSYFDNNISVATCGSNLSRHQVELLIKNGVQELVIAYDRQYKEYNDEECQKWCQKLKKIGDKYKDFINISIVLDKEHLLGYKDSPIDCGKETFIKLFERRITL